MSYKIISTPVSKLSVHYGACVGNFKITLEGSQKEIIREKWIGMTKITALQQAREQQMSLDDSNLIAEFIQWYLKEVSILYPPSFVENDDILFGPESYLCRYESPTYRIFKCKEKISKDISINFKAENIIHSPEGSMISKISLQGMLNLGPLTEVKATEIFHRDKTLMLVGTFINSVNVMTNSPDEKSSKSKK